MSKDARMDDKQVVRDVALRTLRGRYVTGGIEVNVHVDPCAWMYPGYGFQFSYATVDGSCHNSIHGGRDLTVETATRGDVQRLLDTVLKPAQCARCKVTYLFDPKSNRGTLCEKCWMEDWQKGVDALMEKERRKVARKDANMLKKGYTHRITAWVHPTRGDDYAVDMYTKGQPSADYIRREIKKMGSRVDDDYSVTALAPNGGKS